MARLHDLIATADSWLNLSEIPDYPQALNGLQLESSGEVNKIVAAVDASEPVIAKACASGAHLLVVHHGLFWQGAKAITGSVYRKLSTAVSHDLAIYSAHIPLDVHAELGNNAVLIASLELDGEVVPFFPWKGIDLGLSVETSISRDELVDRVAAVTGARPHLCPGGPDRVQRIGIITGGAGSEVEAVAATGVDTFITGEGPHWSYPLAEELGLNVIYAGHYATETFGVKALAEKWCREFDGTTWEFIDHPTGL